MDEREPTTHIHDLYRQISEQHLTRRTVLKRATALGLSAPVIAGLLAACGGDDDDTPDPTATTATSAPTIPPEKTSQYVALTFTGGHGSSHRIGEQIVLCYGSLAGQYIRLLDYQPPGTLNNVIREGVDDGTGECISGIIEGPAGYEVFRIEAWNASRTSVVDYAELWIIVTQ